MADNEKLIQPIDADFDAVAGALVTGANAKPKSVDAPDYAELIRELTLPRGWGVPVTDVVNQGQIRLDAEHYDPMVVENDRRLRSLALQLRFVANSESMTYHAWEVMDVERIDRDDTGVMGVFAA